MLENTVSHTQIFTDHEDTLFSLLLTDEASDLFDRTRDREAAIRHEALLTCTDKKWSSMIHILALSNLLQLSIESVYPNANKGLRPLFHQRISPFDSPRVVDAKFGIIWSRDGNLDTRTGFAYEPNHFALLISNDVYTDDCSEVVSNSVPGCCKDVSKSVPKCNDISNSVPECSEAAVQGNRLDIDTYNMSGKSGKITADNAQEENPSKVLDDAQSFLYDIGRLLNSSSFHLTDQERYKFLEHHFRPDENFSQFCQQTVIKGTLKKKYTLTFQYSWLVKYPWLVYSPILGGGLCKYCILFPPQTGRVKNAVLVSRPFVNLTKAVGKDGVFENHANCDYHKQSLVKGSSFAAVIQNPKESVRFKLSEANELIYKKNEHILKSIIKVVLLCGKQNIALRGHRDDSTSTSGRKGNFHAILSLLSDNDDVLRQHLLEGRKNAQYTSKTIQNQLISIIGMFIRDRLTKTLKSGAENSFYSVIADEVTDSSNKEILSLCLRFVSFEPIPVIKEIFFDFLHLEGINGEKIAETLLKSLQINGIDVSRCRGQCYDGASAMSSERVGVQKRVRDLSPRAIYVHCNSHVLNLSIASSSKLPQIRNMIDSINETFLFFRNSPKRQHLLESIIENQLPDSRVQKLKGLCKTRWVERHTCLETFLELYQPVVLSLTGITDPTSVDFEIPSWDRESRIKAQGLLSTLLSSAFIMAFFIAKNVLDLIKPLAVKLQKRDLDILSAVMLIDTCISSVKDLRKDIDNEFTCWYREADELAKTLGTQLLMPRTAGRQNNRGNIAGTDPEEYYKLNIAIPFCDHLSNEMSLRFAKEDRVSLSLLSLLPKHIITTDIDDLIEKLQFWEPDMPASSCLRRELLTWKKQWIDSSTETQDNLTNIIDCLATVDKDIFPNIHLILSIGCVLPITSCEAERSFSALRRTKTYLRSTMGEERLAGLALMNVHSNIEIDIDEILKMFVEFYPRKMFKKSLFIDE